MLQKVQAQFGFAQLKNYLGTDASELFPEGESYEHLPRPLDGVLFARRDRRTQRKEEVIKILDVVFWLIFQGKFGWESLDTEGSVGGMEFVVDIMLVCAYLAEIGAPFMDPSVFA